MIINWIKSQIKLEIVNIRYWYIICFAIGILTGFFLDYFLQKIIFLLFLLLLILNICFRKKDNKTITFLIIFFYFGMLISNIKVLKTTKITDNFATKEAIFTARVEEIRLSSNWAYITVTTINPPNTLLKNKKIKLKYDGDIKLLSIGDIIKINTSIGLIQYGIFPNDKSYENYARYFDIVAKGKIKTLEIINSEKKSFSIDRIRRSIQDRIFSVNNQSIGSGIVIDILTGNNSFIPRDKLQNIRHSGCAHILAISGLHMSVIVSFIFFVFIHIFSLFPKIALKYNTKKLASIPACIACLIYLNIANIPISAMRSYLMVFFGFLALLSNKPKTSMNILFLTFFIILITSPHNILSPSFQMSFMAVFGLISVYNSEFLTQTMRNITSYRIVRYMIGIVSSSVIATIATIFFEIYHFKQYAWIGLISNIAIIPITEFIILPLSFIGMIFNGTFIGDTFYRLSAFFAEYIYKITDWTASLENSFLQVPQMQLYQLGIIILGLIILFLCKTYFFKIIGIIIVSIGIILYTMQPKIVLVYNQNLRNIVFLENNEYYSVNPITNKYLYDVWCQNLGVKKILPMTSDNKAMHCTQEEKQNKKQIKECNFKYKNKNYFFYKKNKNKPIAVYYKNKNFVLVKD